MKTLGMLVLSSIAIVGCATVSPLAEASEEAKAAEGVSDKTREELEKENAALKKENRRLRRELVRQREGEPKVDLSQVREQKGVAGEETNGKSQDDGGFWLATGSMKRHNSKCRYYKMGKGRPCEKNEGTACKRCGG